MREATDEFLLAIAGIAATLVGTFIVAVFFYLDSALHRALVGAEPAWATVAFLVFAAALVVATVDTSRRIAKRGATRRCRALAANEILTSFAVVALVVLPWTLGGWIPSPSDFVPSLLLALVVGFTSTATVTMSVFDAGHPSVPVPQPVAPSRHSATRRRQRS